MAPNSEQRYRQATRAYRGTSRDAWTSVQPYLTEVEGRIWRFIMEAGETGATCEEAELALKIRHQSASPAINAMMRAGLLVDSGRQRRTTSRRKAIVWVIPSARSPKTSEPSSASETPSVPEQEPLV